MYSPKLAKQLERGEVVVLPTDTLYGVVGSALREDVVEKIYRIRKRDKDKPFIILIASVAMMDVFKIHLEPSSLEHLDRIWPGKVSVMVPCSSDAFSYLHRGKGSLVFRVPASPELRDLLRHSGPLLAPSANIQGQEPAHTIDEARAYFGDEVDEYVDGGALYCEPSTIIELKEGKMRLVREGAVTFSELERL